MNEWMNNIQLAENPTNIDLIYRTSRKERIIIIIIIIRPSVSMIPRDLETKKIAIENVRSDT